ncbi:hypothetical protein [Nesterenkonia rhizosphaerae]|uniref:Uncharacterized protein n=1 Tax=Nesterenkonia rhizosphaerae TaxID=1348272 RepID=A0ABP9FW96_9MICC
MTTEAHLCENCTGPVDPFLAGETGLILHRTIRLDLTGHTWAKTRLSMNDRLYPYERNRRTQIWKRLAAKAAANCQPLDWARIVIYYRYPTNHRREVNNLMPTSKAIVDGLVKAGVLADDNDTRVVGPDNRREPVNGPHQVIVRLYRRAE